MGVRYGKFAIVGEAGIDPSKLPDAITAVREPSGRVRVDDGRQLEAALGSSNWERVNGLLDEGYFRYIFTVPDLLQRVFESAPLEWFDTYPRHVMSRAILAATRQPVMLIDPAAQTTFGQWVQSQDAPSTRDVLGVQQAGMRALLAAARYRDAARAADDALDLINRAPDTHGFHDVIPSVLIRCGTAKLLAADMDAAVMFFSEAVRWASARYEHPIARYAREHLAFAYTLTERYRQADDLLREVPDTLFDPGTVHYHFQSAGILARLLVALSGPQVAEPTPLLAPLDKPLLSGDWWWVGVHVRAVAALSGGDRWAVIHAIDHHLLTERARALPETIAGTMLRADLAALYQAVGDLRAAEHVIHTRGLLRGQPGIVLAAARQELLRGQPKRALAVFHADEAHGPATTPARRQPTGAVLYAAAEHGVTGSVSEPTLAAAISAMNHRRAYRGLMQAPPVLREMLLPHLDIDLDDAPDVFTYPKPVKLTRREREVLRALRGTSTVIEVASDLHVSPNTAKTHIQALYRKLGAHSRDEALWLGDAIG
jgi:DNA-binding CsgD family transcriptional regulator